MYFLPSHITSYGSNDMNSIIYNLKGMTEQEEDKKYIIPQIVYNFFDGTFHNDSFKLIYKYNMGWYTIKGSLSTGQKLNKINLSVNSSTFHRILLVIFYLLPLLMYISDGPGDIYHVFFIWTFWAVGLFINYILVKWKIKKIFNKIMTTRYSDNQLKYSYMD